MQSHTPDNRRSERREERFPLRLLVSLADGSTAEVTAQTLVVNKHGAKIYADTELLVGRTIQITIPGRAGVLDGVVVWVSKDSKGIYGIEIDGTPPWS